MKRIVQSVLVAVVVVGGLAVATPASAAVAHSRAGGGAVKHAGQGPAGTTGASSRRGQAGTPG